MDLFSVIPDNRPANNEEMWPPIEANEDIKRAAQQWIKLSEDELPITGGIEDKTGDHLLAIVEVGSLYWEMAEGNEGGLSVTNTH